MDDTLTCLTDWMPGQRWYTSKGRTPSLQRVAEWELPSPTDARVRLLLVADAASGGPVIYQVPIVERAIAPQAGVIGVLPDGTALVDGAADAAFSDWLYATATRGGHVDGGDGPLQGQPAPSAPATAATADGKVLGAEQSNTSLIFRPRDGAGTSVICKLFRQVHPGVNPDIELQTAIAAAGSTSVPAAIGSIDAVWREPGDDQLVRGSLAFAQEFLPNVEDAWRVALGAAEADEDFTTRAEALGRAVADVHLSLGRIFPTAPVTDDDKARIAAAWDRRLAMALAQVPAMAAAEPAIRASYAAALEGDWPVLQRVHGDLHLGQVLEVSGRGWVVLDFEGEPLRPMSERRAADIAARDVAGMLRSFDYAAGSVEHGRPGDTSAHLWASAAKSAFLYGYESAGGPEADPAVLRAFELDKAVYETIYEVRNRPDWLPIPMAAVERLTAG